MTGTLMNVIVHIHVKLKSMHDDLSIRIYIWEDGNCYHHKIMWTVGVVGHMARQLRRILYHLCLCVH